MFFSQVKYDVDFMSSEQIGNIIKSMAKRGLKAVLLKDDFGMDLYFYGDNSFRDILSSIYSARNWMIQKLNMEYSMMQKTLFPTIDVSYHDFSIAGLKFRINNQYDGLLVSYGGIHLICITDRNSVISLLDIIRNLSAIYHILNKKVKKKPLKMLCEEFKSQILQLRKLISIEDKMAVDSLVNEILQTINEIADYCPHVRKYISDIEELFNVIRQNKISSVDEFMRIKRQLFEIFQLVLKETMS